MYLENNRDLQNDFGPKVHEGPIRRRNAARHSYMPREGSARRLETSLIANLSSHSDAINGLAVSPDHMFFVSASDDKTVKVWDTARLERNVTSKPRHTYNQHHARVKAICFVEATHCFVSAADDGNIHVVRVHVSGGQGQGNGLPKYGKLQVIREHRLEVPGQYVTCMAHYATGMFKPKAHLARNDSLSDSYCIQLALRYHAFHTGHPRSPDHACPPNNGEPETLRSNNMHLPRSEANMGRLWHVHRRPFALGPTLRHSHQELACGVSSWRQACAHSSVCGSPHQR